MADRADRFDRSDFDGKPAVQAVKAVFAEDSETYDYIVQPGDTLERIAAKWLGDGSEWPRLVEANRSRIKDPNVIRPGLKLVIPPPREPENAARSSVSGRRVPLSPGARLPNTASRLMRAYLTYKNLPKLERMRFLKILDEVEQDYTKEEMRKADQEWLKTLSGTPLPLETGVALYRAYRRLPIAHRMALVRAALENETAFTLDELNNTNVGTIDPAELEPNWKTTI
ncbi:MAG: LysM peptidoglycan-binding domain-containing protein [Myxococcales bacterium]|nr:LysM peptidoglycan-binding domain-containing protein [Myxococcales bacterium]